MQIVTRESRIDTLCPEIAAISMSGSSVLVAVNAVALKRFKLPRRESRDDEAA